MEVLKEHKTANEIAKQFEVHPHALDLEEAPRRPAAHLLRRPLQSPFRRPTRHRSVYLQIGQLMRGMGLEAIYCRPKTSQANPEHRKFPYLRREVTSARPNFVWSMDITYLPMSDGFLYLAAVIDWFSRYVLAWELSNSLDTTFCMDTLDSAMQLGKPAIFNTDLH